MPEKEVKIPIETAAIHAKRFVPPIIALFTVPYIVYRFGFFQIEIKSNLYFYEIYSALVTKENILKTLFLPVNSLFNSFHHFGLLILVLLPSIVLHELLHALAAIIFSKGKLSSVKFGFDKKTLSPYTHCKLPLLVWQYRIVLALPGIVLGILPGLLAVVLTSPEMLIFGIMFTIGALGDFLMFNILKNYNSGIRIKDHPSTLGFFIVE